MKRQLLILGLGIAGLLAACSPAAITTGTYNGQYTSSVFSSSSGNGTCSISTVNDNTVNVKVTSGGNPDVVVNNVNVQKISIPAVTEVSFAGTDGPLTISGTYAEAAGVKALSLSIDSVGNSMTVVSFTSP